MAAADAEAPPLITLVFPGERAHPAVAEVLAELTAGRDIRVLDLVFASRDADGPVRITRSRQNLDEVGLGSLQIGAQALISEDDLRVVSGSLKPGTSAAMIAYEHSWARRLASAVRDAGGTIVLNHPAGRRVEASYREQQAVAESEAAVRQAEEEAAAAERAAERYATLGSSRTAADDVASRLADLARLRESGALSAAEFEVAKARLLAT
jgi:Family of unknown function (DUF6325)/Short C-terminal domain